MVEESSGKEACAMAVTSGGRLMKYALPKKDQAYSDVVRPENANSTRDMSPRELIRLLILALKAEVVEFYFPWFQFYLDCSELLSSVHRECLSISSQTGAPTLPQEKGRDVSVLLHILSQIMMQRVMLRGWRFLAGQRRLWLGSWKIGGENLLLRLTCRLL